ncbi:aminomethyl-transferring glycine dehydrogenase subunit GcvPA [Hoylesella shahii]|uniref:Probable glycine dehydrogenase (decarboxylating) subunit 1 n=1 Tax=Hoylesella shahii DSM 15611 = JCM 12083 TaxID=1122991 RepID=A0A318HWH6_9BACT|nr:aminomethyl-transferring glycine dehydrogenase subunit GcvPA [Hoylesella shahii]PXX22794.1 glycine cleavage system pyridoxal-binding protein P [Hoylesella shahii DSM 15611 = JCM 12083]
MQYKFFPHTEEDIKLMLDKIGVPSLDALFAEVPEEIRFRRDYDLPSAKSEIEIRNLFGNLGKQNKQLTVFAGGGVYDHYTPSIVPYLVSRSEFLTSYTPYQAEISQGTLHYIFEFQSMMAELTGLPIANASMYDGSTATAEAAIMAVASGKKANKVLVSETVDDKILAVIRTYTHFQGVQIEVVPAEDGITSRTAMQEKLQQGGVAGMIVQQPNKYGIIENYDGFADDCHQQKALFVMNSVAADLTLLKSPGELGADIAVGDGQSLGLPMQFGGPSVGYLCCTEKLMRKMPGRIVGQTRDNRGQRVFVLTLQAREQHIRREKATSNICSNQSLMALWATIYLSVMGKEGVKEAAQRSVDGAHYLYHKLIESGKFKPAFNQPFFNEFCVKYVGGDLDQLQQRLLDNGILGGIKMADDMLMLAVTEKRTKEEVDLLVSLVTQ